jgi:3-dehydroquinate synthase
MQPIQASNYSIYFNQDAYVFLNSFLKDNKYSKLFILVDTNTNDNCLPHFLSLLAIENEIEIIYIESGEAF